MNKNIFKFVLYSFIILLFFTFISKTVTNYVIPNVTYVEIGSGELMPEINGYGKFVTEDKKYIYPESTLKIEDVLVSEGESVSVDTPIVRFDMEKIEEELSQAKLELETLKIESQKYNSLLNDVQDLSTIQRQIVNKEKDIDEIKKNLESIRSLYEAGVHSQKELEDEEAKLLDLETEYSWLQEDYVKLKGQLDSEKKSYLLQLESLQNRISLKELEITKLDSIEEYLYVPDGMIVTKIKVLEGQNVTPNDCIIEGYNRDAIYQLEAEIPLEEADLIYIGNKAKVYIGNDIVGGKINSIYADAEGEYAKIKISFNDNINHVTLGRTARFQVRRPIEVYPARVPNTAIYEGYGGMYVYVLSEKKSLLGEKYSLHQRIIVPGNNSSTDTGVFEGVSPGDKVVVSSNKPLSNGCDVYVKQ